MPDKRLVHDILSEGDKGNQRRPVSFIQHGNVEDGFVYEVICPWCGGTICYVPKSMTMGIGGPYRIFLKMQKEHWPLCSTNNGKIAPKEFAVEITTRPLNVEKAFTLEVDDDRLH